jgi:hypothetical protein
MCDYKERFHNPRRRPWAISPHGVPGPRNNSSKGCPRNRQQLSHWRIERRRFLEHHQEGHRFAEDVLGCTDGHKPRHAKTYRNFASEYARLQQERINAFKEFIADVNTGGYPQPQHNVAMQDEEFEAFNAAIGR